MKTENIWNFSIYLWLSPLHICCWNIDAHNGWSRFLPNNMHAQSLLLAWYVGNYSEFLMWKKSFLHYCYRYTQQNILFVSYIHSIVFCQTKVKSITVLVLKIPHPFESGFFILDINLLGILYLCVFYFNICSLISWCLKHCFKLTYTY